MGAIDSTHVRMQTPEKHEDAYLNRHFYHSINVQLVVDSHCRIINVAARWSGGTRDVQMLVNTSLVYMNVRDAHHILRMRRCLHVCTPNRLRY